MSNILTPGNSIGKLTCLSLLFILNSSRLEAATCTWAGGTGNWSDPAKWSCGLVPGSGDSVVINTGTVTLDQVATVFALRLGGGDMTLNFNLTVSGNMYLLSSSSLLNGTGDLGVNGNLTWSSGTISGSGTFTLLGTLTCPAGSAILDARALSLNSGGTWSNSSFRLQNGAVLTIPVSQILTISTTTSINTPTSTTGSLIIAGTLVKNGAQALDITRTSIMNSGTININGSTLNFTTGSSSTHPGGEVNVAASTTLEFSAGTHTFSSNAQINGAGTFSMLGSGTTVNLNTGSDLTTSAINLTNGTLNVNSNQTFPAFTMDGGDLVLADTAGLTISGNMSLTSSSSVLSGNGNLAINGNLTWSRGTISGDGDFTLNGVFTGEPGQNAILDTRDLILNAGATWTDFELDLLNGATITVPSGHTLTINLTPNFGSGGTAGTPGSIINNGAIIKNGTGEYTITNNILDNNGTLTINAGKISLGTGSSSTHDDAIITIASGAVLELGGSSTHDFTSTAISGAGTFSQISASTVSLNVGTTISTHVTGHATGNTPIIFNIPATILSLTIQSTTIVLNQSLTITGDADLLLCEINGSGDLTINGNLIWRSGTITGSGAFTLTGTLTANTNNITLDTRSLTLTSGGLVSSIVFLLSNGAILTIPPGQTLTLNAGGTAYIRGENLINNGTIEKTGSGTAYLHNSNIQNNGDIHVNEGELIFYRTIGTASSVHDGAMITIAAGSELTFNGGNGSTHDFSTTSITGPGIFRVESGAQVNWNAGTTVSNLPIVISDGYFNFNLDITIHSLTKIGTSGGLGGTFSALTVSGDMSWNGGDITPSNPSTISVGSVFTMNGASNLNDIISKVSINLNGGGTWTNGGFKMQDNAQFIIPSGQTLTISTSSNEHLDNGTGGGILINNGTLIKTGTAIYNINTPYSAGAGSFTDIQQGTLDFNNTLTNGGTIKGTGTLNVSGATVSSIGTISPGASPGTLTITGNYTNESLEIEVVNGSPVLFDKLVVSGIATLGGTLTVTETGSVPTGTYNIISAGSISGTFASVVLPECYGIEIVGGNVNLYKGVAKVWDGSVGTWSTETSWDPHGVPCILDDVVINSGQVTLDVAPEMESLAVNGGTLATGTGNTWTIDAPFVLAVGGTLDIGSASTLIVNDIFTHNGLITGVGTLDDEAATTSGPYYIAPGNSAGKLTKKGTYCNGSSAMEIGEQGGGVEIDELEVTKTMELDGLLEFEQLYGTVPPGTYEFAHCSGSANCRSGTYATVTLPPGCTGNCSIQYSPNSASLVVTAPLYYTCLWNGSVGNYSDPNNWSCGEVPPSSANIIINSGQVIVNGDIAVAGLFMTGGTLSGTGNLTVENALEWSGGTISLAGSHQAASIALSNSPALSNGTLSFTGTSEWANPNLTISGGGVLNVPIGALLIVTSNTASSIAQGGGGSFTIAGTLVKNGTATWTVNVPLTVTGLLNVFAGVLKPGSAFHYAGTVQGLGFIDLTGTAVSASGNGNFAPGNSPGKLNVLGNYTNVALNAELVEIGGTVSHDLLEVENNAVLGGHLNLIHLGGTIPYGTYTILTCGGPGTCLNGDFDDITYPAFCGTDCDVVVDHDLGKVDFVFSSPLPVELVRFGGHPVGGAIELVWETASEVGFSGFGVQRSADGRDWSPIGRLPAKGVPGNYSLTDRSPFRGPNHYRLKMEDVDGTFEHSKVVVVKTAAPAGWEVLPNPVSGALAVHFPEEETGSLVLTDWSGRQVLSKAFLGEKTVGLDLSGLAAGMYWLRFSGGGGQAVVKQR